MADMYYKNSNSGNKRRAGTTAARAAIHEELDVVEKRGVLSWVWA